MFYATFKGIGYSDIAVFQTKQDRDDWVNFRDSYSKVLRINKDSCTFERIPLSSKKAKQIIKTMIYVEDKLCLSQGWYIGTYIYY